jgi:hypothetical protein
MRRISGLLLVVAVISVGSHPGPAQAVASAQGASVPASTIASANSRTEKQKALALQTERLFDMATQLKVEVDKTNKNILSLKVVEKAEEIEALAKGIRTQAKK